jgi:DNA-binding MarR family transcriptional regulator
MDRIDSCLIALRRILRATEIYGRELAQISGLTAVQFRVLQVVSDRVDCTAKDISQQMGVAQATVTTLVDKLVSQGMVVRRKSETDRRQVHIVMTDRGISAVAAAPDALQQRFARRFQNLSDWEQSMLIASLERVAAMMDATDLDVAPVLDLGDIGRPATDP